MSQYVYTVIDPSGNSISVADQTYVNTAVTNAQIADNLYADNATSKVKTEINTTVNTLVANAVAAVLPQIPIGANVITASCKLKIVKPAVPAVGTTPAIPEETVILTLRDQSYIDSVVAACNTLTLQEIAAAQTTLNDIAVASATNAQANSKLYTDQQIQALKAILTSTYATLVYVDNHKWLSADITDLPTTLNTFGNSITVTGAITGTTSNGVITTKFAPIADPINPTDPANMRWVSDQFEEVNKSIQDLDVVGCTFETWLNYWARADAYLDELYDTVDEEYYRQMGWIT